MKTNTSLVGTVALAITLSVTSGMRPRAQAPDLGVSAKDGVVVSSSDIASDIGAAVLARGGTAVDAAVATAFALSLIHISEPTRPY